MLSTALSRLLDRGTPDEAVEEILASPALYAECGAVLMDMKADAEAAMRPAGNKAIMAVMAKLLPIYHQPERSEAEWKLWWEAYFDVLATVPAQALEGAVREWLRSTAQFMPKPGELFELSQTQKVPAYSRYLVVQVAMTRGRDTFSPEELAERRKLVADVLDKLGSKRTLDMAAIPPIESKREMADRLRRAAL